MIGEELKTMNRNERKHLNEIKEQMTQEYLDMLPDALDALRDIIGDPDINPIARVQAIGLIMDRGLGKPEENIRIQHMEDDMDEAQERLNLYKAENLNRVLTPLKDMMKNEEYAELLGLIEITEDGKAEMSYSDAMILLTQYKSALTKYHRSHR